MTPRALLTLLALGGVWGASFLFIKVVVEETSPLEVVLGRLLFGAVVVLAFLALKGGLRDWTPSLWAKAAVMALLANVLPFALIAWAEVHIESGTASVLNSSMPLFTSLFAAVFLTEEQFSPGRLAGLVVGFLGVAVLTGGDVLDIGRASVLGELAVVGAAACYGLATVYARTILRSQEPLALSGLQLLTGTLIALPLLLAVEGAPDLTLSLEAWLSLLAMGAVGTGAAYVVYLWLIERVGSVRTSLVTYIIPVVGLLLGWAVLDEAVGVNTLLGAALIIGGVASVARGQVPALRRAPAPSLTAE